MKRLFAVLIILLALVCVVSACGTEDEPEASAEPPAAATETTETSGEEPAEKLSVVTTIFPQYDIVREIAGDDVELKMLLSPGAESHSYEPTPQDIIDIQSCDVFIYVGGDSDVWVDTILDSMDTGNMEIISLMDLVDVVEEEIVEGMENDHGHSHGSSDFEDEEVLDRDLSDWAGDWQSVYPYLVAGELAEVMEHRAEGDEEMTEEDYYAYYATGYETDVERIVIDGDAVEFFIDGVGHKAEYAYTGFEILHYESGSKGVRYLFEAVGETDGAPRYIQFSDHEIGPATAEHFHLYFGDESHDALLEEMDNWPTYYPSELDAAGIVEEMIGHDHDDDDDDHDDDDHDDVEYDEHVWTSPVNAQILTRAIAETLAERDPSRSEQFLAASEDYIVKLQELDEAFREVVADGRRDTIIVGDRFPFRYFADEYGLTYYAAFSGCSTATDASAATIAFLINKTSEENIPVVFQIELSNGRIADTICEESGAEKMLLHSCHNVTKDEFEAGVTYLDLMWQNVDSLEAALQ